MPNVFTQIYIQIVFAVKGRQSLVPEQHREALHKYITGIASKRQQKLLSIFAMPDHVHILLGLDVNTSLSDLVRDIKSGSSKFINESQWTPGKFNWQEGYGAFSYSRSHVDRVVQYILNQEEHHKRNTFKDEYITLLRKFEIKFEEKYLFEFL